MLLYVFHVLTCMVQADFVQEHSTPQSNVRIDHCEFRIESDTSIAPDRYSIDDPTDFGAVVIAGDNLTVDFQGATLAGAAPGTPADRYHGRGIVILGRNVTVKNAVVTGYKVGIFAKDSPGLTLEGCDVSRNFRQRLKSTPQREDLSDWLYGHENDAGQWLRYGSGIYLQRCSHAVLRNNHARNGQNGICLVRSDHVQVVDNDMSFMSGWGLAMWRSSHCEVYSNKFDWCIRGYSHGVYSRGQDSAGILVYEQCHGNIFAYNSATHGGDGFFLYAGNETVEKTGFGGCNYNTVYKNDFSHAAANGIEATFSHDNLFIENILKECTHGVWAGYSYDTVIEGNRIENCENGISIEHGGSNDIFGNVIRNTRLGVHLWFDDDKELLSSPFAKENGGSPSRENAVIANRFTNAETAIKLVDDLMSFVLDNSFEDVKRIVHVLGNTRELRLAVPEDQRLLVQIDDWADVRNFGGETYIRHTFAPHAMGARIEDKKWRHDAFLPSDALRGRQWIFVDEWGPYDFTDLRVFPVQLSAGSRVTVQAVGRDKPFTIANKSGNIEITPEGDRLPTRLTVEATSRGISDFKFEIESGGDRVAVTGSLFSPDWTVEFREWTKEQDPRQGSESWEQILASPVIDQLKTDALDFVWYGRSPTPKMSKDYFVTVARTSIPLPAGRWSVQTLSDDGVRVFIDDRQVLANWTWHGPTEDQAVVDLEAGEHVIRVEHFEIDGHAQLKFGMEKSEVSGR